MAETAKRTVTISVGNLSEARSSLANAFRGVAQEPRITFPSLDLMWRTLTPRRQELLQAMAGKSALSIRGLARLVHRDVKAVHGDVQALLLAGVVRPDEAGGVIFPYDALHVDYELEAVA